MNEALLDPALVAGVTPRPPQQVAVDELLAAFSEHARAQVRMACGVGKTHVGILTAATTRSKRVVVAVPSLSLVDQTLRAWIPLMAKGSQTIAVCSAEGLFTATGPAVGPRVTTTDPARIGFLLGQDAPTLVVTTYKSLTRLAAGVRDSGNAIDLLVLDEAHHLTGHLEPGHRAALDDIQLPATRRLAMTATPVIATQADTAGAAGFDPFTHPGAASVAISMDDEQLFGPVAYLYSTRQAIEAGYLCDYEVLVVSRIDTPFNRQRLPLAALAAAANERGVTRALSFHNWVADARAFTNLLNVSSHQSVRFVADTITGTTPSTSRRKILTELAGQCGPGVVRVVTAAKCLREGVDVCAVDAVLFASPRSSTVEIVQAVGRALRTHPGKERGTIILPLLLPPGRVDDDEQLTDSQFAHIWKVLRALNAHDPRISESLLRARAPQRTPEHRGTRAEERQLPHWLHLVGGIDADTILGRLVSPTCSAWDDMFQTLSETVAEVGSAHRVKITHVHRGRRIGHWVVTQRHHYHRGVMEPSRVDRLEQLPGWTWRTESLLDHRMVDRLEAFAAAAGTCRDASTGESTYPAAAGEARLGPWLAHIRQAHREGRLEKSVTARLERLPRWTWEPLEPGDRAGVDALQAFVAWEGTAVVPSGHIEGDVALAEWLDSKGRAYLTKRLPPELYEEIRAVCPTDAKGQPRFAWDVSRLRSEAGLTALRQYAAKSGGAIISMPTAHQEQVDGLVINLYQWCARLRWLARRGELAPSMRAELEQIPGWVWDLREARTRVGPPITLPPGVPHGLTHTRAYFGCPCQECDRAARNSQTAFKRQQTQNLTAGWVTSPAGATRAKRLMAANPWAVPLSVAAAACMPRTLLGTLLVDPDTTRVPPWIAARLEALTADQVRQWHRDGSRGRSVSRAMDLGDPVRHQRLLQQLRVAGWKDAEIGSALGYRGSAAHATRPNASAAVVHALTQLVRSLGPGTPVPTWLSQPSPALQQPA